MIAASDWVLTKVERSKLAKLISITSPLENFHRPHAGSWFWRWSGKPSKSNPINPCCWSLLAALHYGQAIFESIKAFKNAKGEAFMVELHEIFAGSIFRTAHADAWNFGGYFYWGYAQTGGAWQSLDSTAKRPFALYQAFMFSSDHVIAWNHRTIIVFDHS